jgi:hypothetical protein
VNSSLFRQEDRESQVASKRRGSLELNGALEGAGEHPAHPARVRRATRARSTPADLRLALLTAGIAAFGCVLILVDDDATAPSRVYTSTPEFKVWAALTIGLIAALPAVGRVGIDLLRRLGRTPRRVRRREAMLAVPLVVVVVGVAVLAGLYARGSASPYYGGTVRIAVVYLLAVTAAVPPLMAMWECYRQLGRHDTGGPDAGAGVSRLLLLRECLLSALTTVGLLVSAGVLITGAQRQAVLADAKFTSPYPSAYVLIFGLAFSALLVVNFLPAFRRLSRQANATIEAILPVLPPGADGWQNRLQERTDLAGLLQVTSGLKDVLTSAVLVAGPLISSAFSMFLPGPPS